MIGTARGATGIVAGALGTLRDRCEYVRTAGRLAVGSGAVGTAIAGALTVGPIGAGAERL